MASHVGEPVFDKFFGDMPSAEPVNAAPFTKKKGWTESVFLKILTCIPIIGVISQVICERSLKNRIIKEINEELAIVESAKNKRDFSVHVTTQAKRDVINDLIRSKNHFKNCGTVRDFLNVALTVAGIGLLLVSPFLGIVGICVFGAVAIIHQWRADDNRTLMRSIMNMGITDFQTYKVV